MTTPFEPQTAAARPSEMRKFVVASVILLLVFSLPLYHLVRFALQNTLYSHIILIPFISLFLVWQRRSTLAARSTPNRQLAVVFFVAGIALLIGLELAVLSGSSFAPEDSLSLSTLAFLLIFAGICAWFLCRRMLRAVIFPLAFLLFIVPLPVFFVVWVETLLQHGSAMVAHGLFSLAGTTVFVDQLTFQLPGITLMIAPECSGIHSSLALLITSVLAGYVVLRSPGKRMILALAVIPLALLRNGLRVFVIGELCVRIGPEMINSYIHRHGGPLFFVLSLIPFFLLLLILVRSESKIRVQPAIPC